MTEPATGEFDRGAVTAICEYMNVAQPESLVYIATAANGDADIHRAQLVGLDGTGIELQATSGDAVRSIRVPWLTPISERFEVRGGSFALLERALEHLSRD